MTFTADTRKRLFAWYMVTVAIAAAILIVCRWQEASHNIWTLLDMISLSIWHAVVWPFYLTLKAVG